MFAHEELSHVSQRRSMAHNGFTWNHISSIHGIFIFNEAKSIHELNFRDAARGIFKMFIDFFFGDYRAG